MPTIAKLRRTWFALIKEAGIMPADRHAVQERITGTASTTDWTHADWLDAIATLQRELGQHRDSHAHVREDRNQGVAEEPGTWATAKQADYIADLANRVEWRVGAVAYACRTVLAGDAKALRRERLKEARDAGKSGAGLWSILTRQEASDLILALEKAVTVYPRETAHA